MMGMQPCSPTSDIASWVTTGPSVSILDTSGHGIPAGTIVSRALYSSTRLAKGMTMPKDMMPKDLSTKAALGTLNQAERSSSRFRERDGSTVVSYEMQDPWFGLDWPTITPTVALAAEAMALSYQLDPLDWPSKAAVWTGYESPRAMSMLLEEGNHDYEIVALWEDNTSLTLTACSADRVAKLANLRTKALIFLTTDRTSNESLWLQTSLVPFLKDDSVRASRKRPNRPLVSRLAHNAIVA